MSGTAETTSERQTSLMVVEDDPGVGYAVARWLASQQIKAVLVTSVREAMQMLQDLVFIEAKFDGLLVDYNLPDATGCRVIQEFQAEFPKLPVALMTGAENISLEIWLKARRIPLFRKPLKIKELETWLQTIRSPQAGGPHLKTNAV